MTIEEYSIVLTYFYSKQYLQFTGKYALLSVNHSYTITTLLVL